MARNNPFDDFDIDAYNSKVGGSSSDGGSSFDDFDVDAYNAKIGGSRTDPQYGPGSEMEKYKQEMAEVRRKADWRRRGLIGEGRRHLGKQEDGSDAFEYDAVHAPAFAPQDEEGRAVHERVKAFEGGNLSHFNRPMKIEYDEKTGKAKGYGTTKSTVVEELDGTWSVIPTIWRDEKSGKPVEAIDEEDARIYYRENGGKRFGNFKTKDEAIAAAKDIHELHQRAYGAKWNQWINEHWDEVDDSVKNTPGVKEAHAAWVKAGKPGIRFTMRLDGEKAAEGTEGADDWPDSAQRKPMGILEHGAKTLQAKTGKKYGEGEAALLNFAPFGAQVEGYDANRRVAALEKARTGDYEDGELEEVAKRLGFWEDVRPVYAVNKAEARNAISEMATAELKGIVRGKDEAERDMDARPLSGWGKVVASTLENSGYV
ncbi:MAG: hypothetical protein J6V72_12140, partial [Kiritimatiellae bacterium]|nr:hypothetical protein [Kiritimatiellia bacterium]